MIRAEEVKPGSFIRYNGDVFTVRYCYYDHEYREVTFDLEKGKVKLHPLFNNTVRTLTYGFDDDIFIVQ